MFFSRLKTKRQDKKLRRFLACLFVFFLLFLVDQGAFCKVDKTTVHQIVAHQVDLVL
jgi:hypothetical protein